MKRARNESNVREFPNKANRTCVYCGFRFPKDKDLCPSCKMAQDEGANLGDNDGIISLEDVEGGEDEDVPRISTGPWDISFGPGPTPPNCDFKQGIPIPGLIAIGGAPGAGKSTLALQILAGIIAATEDRDVLYVSKEEGSRAIKARAVRLGLPPGIRKRIRIYPQELEVDLGLVLQKYKPCAVIIDSIQRVAFDIEDQVAFVQTLRPYAEELQAPFLIISHVNKDLDIAGLMALQHEVDTIMMFTIPTMDSEVRELVPMKNRFGEANFVKHLLMTPKGLVDYNIEEGVDDDEDGEDD